MPELPKKKVGIIACSGEEMAEGTITRLAALKVLEALRPDLTVTICLPLFLAGGQGERAFAKFHPTITIDGCEKRCAARSTEMYSNKPAASIVVSDLIGELGLKQPGGCRKLDEAGMQAVDRIADRTAQKVDEILGKAWNRRDGAFVMPNDMASSPPGIMDAAPAQAACSCTAGIPSQEIVVNGTSRTLLGLPLMLETLFTDHEPVTEQTARSLLEMVKIYNPISSEEENEILTALLKHYREYAEKASPIIGQNGND